MTLALHFLTLLALFSPALIANALPVFAQHVPLLSRWNTPISSRWFGSHKTYRGFTVAILGGGIIGLGIGQWIPQFFNTPIDAFLYGSALGFGALFGDLIESFIKRRKGKKPGESWFFWDGVDYILGALVVVFLWGISITWIDTLILLVLAPTLSTISNRIAYWLGIKNVWY